MARGVEEKRVSGILSRLDEASAALGEAREILDESFVGEAAEEQRHDCSMAQGLIEEVAAVLEPLAAREHEEKL